MTIRDHRDRKPARAGGIGIAIALLGLGSSACDAALDARRDDAPVAIAPESQASLREGSAALTHARAGEVVGRSFERRRPRAPGEYDLYRFIDRQVGGIGKLKVPASFAALPQPRAADGSIDPRYRITEQKRYLGKMLFVDPIRNQRIRAELGGIDATRETMSCASCHNGFFGGKAGQVFNLGVCGEGVAFTDALGGLHARRRRDSNLLGCERPDLAPTLSVRFPGTPQEINGNGDAVDSVARLSPSVMAAGFSTRLLAGGLAGDLGPGGFHRNDNPPLEDLTFALQDAHRMLERQSAAILRNPAYVQAFREAFPEAAQAADRARDMTLLVNDDNIAHAVATFMRTAVTRETPWDRFLDGDEGALTASQREGARLFFTGARSGGAGCYGCHSGPLLNKQLGDEAGLLVEENFVNLGLLDHPLHTLNNRVFDEPTRRDRGRAEVTGNLAQNYQFKVQTLRQLKHAGQFMHNGLFPTLESVVQYFNAGVPQDQSQGGAGRDPSLSRRFTHPRGNGERGLGLSDAQVRTLVDFLENALYDEAYVTFAPRSPTDTFFPNERDLTYSKYHPSLAAAGAVDGRLLGGPGFINNDPLSRRDLGLDPPLEVSSQISHAAPRVVATDDGFGEQHVYTLVNRSERPIDTHLLVAVEGLASGVRVRAESGGELERTSAGTPYYRAYLSSEGGVLFPGASTTVTLVFTPELLGSPLPARTYRLRFYSGQGRLP